MKIKQIVRKNIFIILSMILILCCADQLYMIEKYKNINLETFSLTIFLTVLNIYFGFVKK